MCSCLVHRYGRQQKPTRSTESHQPESRLAKRSDPIALNAENSTLMPVDRAEYLGDRRPLSRGYSHASGNGMFQLGLREGEMRSFHFESLAAWIVLLVFACPCVAQKTATLDDLAAGSELAKTSNKPQTGDAKAAAIRPAGTLTRPKDGVQHPDLDKAWAEYDASVSKVTASIKAATTKQFDAAAAKGDLDTAEKWQATLEKFEKTGELPTEKETKMAVSAAVVEYKKAKDELSKAYEAVVTALTMEKKITEARAARTEKEAIADAPRQIAAELGSREVTLKMHLTSDWGSVTLFPASAVEIGRQEIVRGEQQWKINGNVIDFRGQPFRNCDTTVQITCRLKGSAKELILETHKGNIGALYVEAVRRGEVLGRFTNEGSQCGNDSCRREFKLVLP